MKSSFILLCLLMLPLAAEAQTDLEGAWLLTFNMNEGAAPTMNIHAKVVQDSLHLVILSDHGETALKEVSSTDTMLHFVLSTDHGNIACALHRKKEDEQDFSGLCDGPMGEIPTTMTRPVPNLGGH